MKFAKSAVHDDFEISVIPLIDVMLTLLMFFVMTATFEHRSLMRVALPESSADPVTTEQEALTILIDAEGRTYVGANEVLNPNVDTIKDALAAAAGEDRDRPVSLRADGKTPHQAVITAMDALGQLGFAKLSIATVPAKSGPAKSAGTK
jgi:biopolymer transport protein ExbD